MGILASKDFKQTLEAATSNSSLSNLRYIITEKPKWKVFRKKEVKAIPNYTNGLRPLKGCQCGNDGPCKQKVTPKGVTIHYPQKRRRLKFGLKTDRKFTAPGQKALYTANTKIVRPKKYSAWRVDAIAYENNPFSASSSRRRSGQRRKPRAASAYAVGPVKLAFLDVETFERLLGPCMEIMKRNIDDYEEQLVKLFGDKSNLTDVR